MAQVMRWTGINAPSLDYQSRMYEVAHTSSEWMDIVTYYDYSTGRHFRIVDDYEKSRVYWQVTDGFRLVAMPPHSVDSTKNNA